MKNTLNTEQPALKLPALPSGGGSISELRSDVAPAGPEGAATMSIPLPASEGRGYGPALSMTYHSPGGNGPFGGAVWRTEIFVR